MATAGYRATLTGDPGTWQCWLCGPNSLVLGPSQLSGGNVFLSHFNLDATEVRASSARSPHDASMALLWELHGQPRTELSSVC